MLQDMGSPPRMRGKEAVAMKPTVLTGITPAYAGKRNALLWPICRTRDHPRVCGEKQLVAELPKTSLGSPPRMRGKVACTRKAASPFRITPAYAGKRTADHCDPQRRLGSPPRMRGKVAMRCPPMYSGRITPAYAGKRMVVRSWWPRSKDHPRVCGEKVDFGILRGLFLGSPPRMRGKD